MGLLSLVSFVLISISAIDAFPHFARGTNFTFPGAQPLPDPVKDKSSKLVHDILHPYLPPVPLIDQRGPCPGLNTLANHGYLPRTGVASPGQIITAVQEGFNMGFGFAAFVTYAAFIVDGNHETNLLSIGGETLLTGPNPPAPAQVLGLNAHKLFEGDASTTRSDAALGNNHEFNMTLFNQMADAAVKYGNGAINFTSMAEHRYNRIVDSIARNPTFDLSNPRYLTVYAESAFPLRFFVNGTKGYLADGSFPSLDVNTALGFFRDGRMPAKFWRREGAYDLDAKGIVPDQDWLRAKHPVPPGKNQGVGNYVPDTAPLTICAAYNIQLSHVVEMYPPDKVTGRLRDAVKQNIRTFYSALPGFGSSLDCDEIFPYGQ